MDEIDFELLNVKVRRNDVELLRKVLGHLECEDWETSVAVRRLREAITGADVDSCVTP